MNRSLGQQKTVVPVMESVDHPLCNVAQKTRCDFDALGQKVVPIYFY